jgi:hypothetical protein
LAGLGRKTWSPNDILAAADVNGYLMDQSVMVFNDAAAREAEIPSPDEGMLSYRKDSNIVEVYTGAAYEQIFPAVVNSLDAGKLVVPGTAVTASMTATSAVANGAIWVNAAGAVTVTIPDVLDLYDHVIIHRNGGGTVTIAAGTGVTNWAGAGTAGTAVTFKIDQLYGAAGVQKVAANTYRVVGRIVV